MVLDAAGEDHSHVLRSPIAVGLRHPLYPVLHLRGVGSRTEFHDPSAFVQVIAHSQVERVAVFGFQGVVASRIPIEVVERGIAVVVAVAHRHADAYREMIRDRGRGEYAHRFAVDHVVTRGEAQVSVLEGIALKSGIHGDHVAPFDVLIVV